MEQMLWLVIRESKSGQEYLNPEIQYQNLENILDRLDKAVVKQIEDEWRKKVQGIINGQNDEFEGLHVQDGGIISAGDDGFYMDFANWFIAQGEELFKKFQEEGRTAVLDYIEKHRIPREEYLYECMVYVFHKYE